MYILIKNTILHNINNAVKEVEKVNVLIKEALTLFQCKEIEGSKDDMSND